MSHGHKHLDHSCCCAVSYESGPRSFTTQTPLATKFNWIICIEHLQTFVHCTEHTHTHHTPNTKIRWIDSIAQFWMLFSIVFKCRICDTYSIRYTCVRVCVCVRMQRTNVGGGYCRSPFGDAWLTKGDSGSIELVNIDNHILFWTHAQYYMYMYRYIRIRLHINM